MKRVDQLLSASGKFTRKEAKDLLKKGRVTVDGVRCSKGDEKISLQAVIAVDGEALLSSAPLWIMLHKPPGYVSATEDAQQETVMELLPLEYRQRQLFPVGRLDKDTEGLLLLTDDGDMAHQILSPRKKVPKVYEVQVEGTLLPSFVADLERGILLGDGLQCLPATLEILPPGNRGYITLVQGKYHQIKRMMACLGTPVRYLKRLSMAGITLDPQLPLGDCRPLTQEEIGIIYHKKENNGI